VLLTRRELTRRLKTVIHTPSASDPHERPENHA
jgi:hypothetical protein